MEGPNVSGAEGNVVFHVWPAHVGFGTHPHEVLSPDVRSQIQWRMDGTEIVGGAQPWVPEGQYTHLLYFHDVTGPPCGAAVFAHPFVQPAADYVVVDPIRNEDPALKRMGAITR